MKIHVTSIYFPHLPKFLKTALEWNLYFILSLFCTMGTGKNVAPLNDNQNFRLLPLQKACWLHLSGQRRDVLADISETPGWAKLDMSLDGMS